MDDDGRRLHCVPLRPPPPFSSRNTGSMRQEQTSWWRWVCCDGKSAAAKGRHCGSRTRRSMKLLFSLLLLLASSCGGWLLSPPAAENLLRIHKLVLLVEPPTSSSTSRSLCIHGRRAFPALLMAFERRRRDFENEKDDDVEDDDDDDEEPFPDVNVQNFCPPSGASFGFNRGHSSPATRKAVGTSASSMARIHICTNCGAESVKWMGRCTVCKEWNTMQEHQVIRQAPGSTSNSILGGSGGGGRSRPVFGRSGPRTSSSWLDGVGDGGGSYGSDSPYNDGKPIRITDLYDKEKSNDGSTSFRTRNKRIVIPQDDELNTVLGGGILPGSLTLLGGDPGVGKSTLLLQAAASVATLSTIIPGIGMGPVQSGGDGDDFSPLGPVWYVSGEENPDQIANRALRLGMAESSELFLLGETHADSLCAQVVDHYERSQVLLDSKKQQQQNADDDDDDDVAVRAAAAVAAPSLIVIDSIQTMVCDAASGTAAGGVSQVRECVALFLRLAKSTGIPIMLVGHVTKSGQVAGPRTVEHMVDCVLYLEGAGSSTTSSSDGGGGSSSTGDPLAATNSLRILRASKNRFGSCDEVGVYEMTAGRLMPVSDPSSLFLAQRSSSDDEDAEGCAIAIALEGMRAITIEIQALVVMSSGNSGYGRRTVEGIAYSRLMLLMGVLQKRCRIFLGRQDVYINVAGRMRLDRGGEGHAADLAVAVALVSSLTQVAVRADTVFIGEVGLLGELRSVAALDKRIQEARRMGFSRVITPPVSRRKGSNKKGANKKNGRTASTTSQGMEWIQCDTLMDAIEVGLVAPLPQPKRKRRSTKESSGTIPEQLGDLGLDEILDDDDDEESFL